MEGSILKRKINVLLLAIPLVLFNEQVRAFLEEHTGLSITEGVLFGITFVLAALALIPLAGFVESAVEELAELLGPFVGGLLHTTFGNVAELTIALAVLLKFAGSGGAEIVEGSIAGVIIRNSLLFLGLATLLGCLRNGHMKFNAENAGEYSTVFSLAVIGLSVPTIVSLLPIGKLNEHIENVVLPKNIPLPGFLAVVLAVSYLAYIGFAVFRLGEGYNLVEKRMQRRQERLQRRQQKRKGFRQQLESLEQQSFPIASQPDTSALFAEERASAEQHLQETSATDEPTEHRIYAKAGLLAEKRRKREEEGARGVLHIHPLLRGLIAALVLAIATAGVAAMSEGFAGSVEELIKLNGSLRDYEFFLGLILIPLLAGVVELYGSVGAARENRMEITMAVTAGASIQMILLVVPILVLVGLFTRHPLSLVFKPIEVIIFGAATFIFMLLSRDGESTWLEGVQLCSLWTLVAVATFFVHGGG